ncbi:hypothetical protein BLA50215_01236 [Burkholderia lata]|uniref:hypothetical protein n=1 Tax=Burkholderia lata (strain ATCC 17760 / DSM 23089 / LMG 22485 / NCIMB 9086 / R18194 / 383) TaxID=482957 RepID=UPI0014535BA1|nr:hypothetical protein [Burkholderia lata]VWC80927.1 hypothetical protein BLA50215_01236 [Burkholderia lata]
MLWNADAKKLLGRLEALVCTGAPGLYRVLTFWVIQRIYSLDELGHAASNLSIAQMIGFFTAIGWATLILVRVPASDGPHAARGAFYSLVSMAGLTAVAATLACVLVSAAGVVAFDLGGVVALMWGWTVYQLARHFFVSYRRYRITIAFDCLLIAGSCTMLRVGAGHGYSASLCLAVTLIAVAVAMFVAIGAPARRALSMRIDVKGLQFGLTNFLSGGIALATVPAAKAMCGASFAGMLSLFSSVTAIGNLLPRAISIAQLPDLVKRKRDKASLDTTLSAMRRDIDRSNLVVLVANLAMVAGLTYRDGLDGNGAYAVLAGGVLLAIQCAAGVLGVVGSNVMMAFEQSAVTARINLGTSSLFVVLLGGSVAIGGDVGFFCMLAAAVVVTLIRNAIVVMHARRVCAAYAESIGAADPAGRRAMPAAPGARP